MGLDLVRVYICGWYMTLLMVNGVSLFIIFPIFTLIKQDLNNCLLLAVSIENSGFILAHLTVHSGHQMAKIESKIHMCDTTFP